MKKLFLLVVLCISASIKAQYTTYSMAGFGSISVSDDMELQGGDYQKMSKEFHRELSDKIGYEIDFENKIVFQPNGRNSFQNLKKNYARIIILTEFGEFEPLTNVKPIVSVEEIRAIEEELKNQLIRDFKSISMTLVNFFGVSIEKINNQIALKYSYTRRLGNNPLVKVDVYVFQNKDRKHEIYFSYRVQDKHLWENKFKHTLNNIKIDRR